MFFGETYPYKKVRVFDEFRERLNSMISNPNLIYYACIARGSVILGEYVSKEHELAETLAQQCIDKTPPNHSMFSHTVCKRTYTFLIDDPFTSFAIFDESLEKSKSLWFLNRVKSAFEDMVESGSISDVEGVVTPGCFQTRFDSVLGEIMSLELELSNSSMSGLLFKDGSVDSPKAGRMMVVSPGEGLKKKKRAVRANGDVREIKLENKLDVCDDVVMQKNAFYAGEQQKVKQIWKKHVWIVLVVDLFVCSSLWDLVVGLQRVSMH